MFKCPSCKRRISVQNAACLRAHLNEHKKRGLLVHPIACKQASCKNTYGTVWEFARHFVRKHPHLFNRHLVEEIEQNQYVLLNRTDLPPVPEDAEIQDISRTEHESEDSLDTLKKKIVGLKNSVEEQMAQLSGYLMAKEHVSVLGIEDIMKRTVKVINLLIDSSVDIIDESTKSEKKSEVSDTIFRGFAKVKESLSSFTSAYKIKKQLEKNPQFVRPMSVSIGKNVQKLSNGKIVVKDSLAQYVSIKKTVENLFRDKCFRAEMEYSRRRCQAKGVISTFEDGTHYAAMLSQMSKDEEILFIQLFYDGLGLTNPLKASSTLQNHGMFYFRPLNVRPSSFSKQKNIHLVAMAKTSYLKHDNYSGMIQLLETIQDELMDLFETGIEINLPDGHKTLRVILAQVTGDNLALNELFGFTTAFNGDYCCLFCYCTREDMQRVVFEHECQSRSIEDYKQDLAEVAENPDSNIHVRGVKRGCPLNGLPYFEAVENWINDIMHTFAEGIIPIVASLVLNALIAEGEVTLNLLNEEINQVFSTMIVEKKNKPCQITCVKPDGKGFSPKLSAAQTTTFFQFLPLLIGRYVDEKNKYWKLLLLLEEIVDYVLAPSLEETSLSLFSCLYAEFLHYFKKIFPTIPIRPKFHFPIHFEKMARKHGMMKGYSCMAHERFNKVLKNPAKSMNNFRNAAHTIAYRRQYSALIWTLAGFGSQEVEYGPFKHIGMSMELENLLIQNNFFLHQEEDMYAFFWVKVNGIHYRPGAFVVLGIDRESYLTFGKIDGVIGDCIREPYFIITIYETLDFVGHLHSYQIVPKKPVEKKIAVLSNFFHYIPLDAVDREGLQFVRLKYYITHCKENCN